MNPLRIGSRGSKLALWQAEHLKNFLSRDFGQECEIVVIKTSGDNFAAAPVQQLSDSIGGKGIFIKEIEEALLFGRIDIAVHSMKDVPSEFSDACRISVVFEREDPRDCLISRSADKLESLPHRARVGTSSVRRASQLRRIRPDFVVKELRGNVDTRLRKLDSGEYDAIVIAKAGVERLGLGARITEVLSTDTMLPAIGQGALGVEFLAASDDRFRPYLIKLKHAPTMLAVCCERALQRELQGGCTVPLGAWARFEDGEMRLDACVLSADGGESIRRSSAAVCENRAAAEALGQHVAHEILDAGGGRLLQLAGRSMSGD